MGVDVIATIKTLHSLTKGLVESIQGEKGAAKAKEILLLVGELQTEYFSLQQNLLKLERDKGELQSQVTALSAAQTPENPEDTPVVFELDEPLVDILKFLVSSDERWKTMDEIKEATGLSQIKVSHFLRELRSSGFVDEPFIGTVPEEMCFGLTHKGRGYLIDRDLVD
jgi:hypothetical protein